MKHAFTVKGNVRIVVDFNPNLYDINEVQSLLQWAIQSENNFEAVQAEIEIQNPGYIEKQLFGGSSSNSYYDDEDEEYLDEDDYSDEIELIQEQPLFDVDEDESDNDGTNW